MESAKESIESEDSEKKAVLIEKIQQKLVLLAEQGEKYLKEGVVEEARKVYVELLRLSHEPHQTHYESQVLGYEGLGKVYERNEKWIDAIAIYHFSLGVMDDAKHTQGFSNIVLTYQTRLIKNIEQCEATFLEQITGKNIAAKQFEHYQQHQASLKKIADEARELLRRNREVKEELQSKQTERDERITYLQRDQESLKEAGVSIEQIHRQISEQLRGLVRTLIEECMEQLKEWKKPLCKEYYAVICFGSLARDEATPYSDLEFGVLLTEGKDTGENKNYFRALTKLLNIKVINLHETTPHMHSIEELSEIGLTSYFVESPIRAGFSFDGNVGGRKTPLGNIEYPNVHDNKRYELIKTPKEMADYQSEEWFKLDNRFSSILYTAQLIMGNDHLLVQYEVAMEKILDTPVPPIITQFLDDEKSKPQEKKLSLRQFRSLFHLRDSIDKFQFRGGRFGEGIHYFDAKFHLYRLPNMILDHLSMYFKAKEKTVWRRIRELFGEKQLIGRNENGLLHLTEAVSSVLGIRLTAYSIKEQRDNYVIDLDVSRNRDNSRLISEHFGVPENRLIDIFRVFIQLQSDIVKFIESNSISMLLESNYFDGSFFIDGNYYHLTLQHKRALEAFDLDLSIRNHHFGENHISGVTTLINLASVHVDLGKYDLALSAYRHAKDILILKLGETHIFVSEVWGNIGNVYLGQREYEKALSAFKQAKLIIRKMYGNDHERLATYQGSIGLVYEKQGQYKKAMEALKKAESIEKNLFGSETILLSSTYNSMGSVYQLQGDYSAALDAYMRSKSILMRVYGPTHISLATVWNNIGSIFNLYGQYEKALSAYDLAISIIIRLYGNKHISLAELWNNLGVVYDKLGLHQEALCVYNEAMSIREQVHGPRHISTAEIWNNIGISYHYQGLHDQALFAYNQAILIRRFVYGSDDISLAGTWDNIGIIYNAQGRHKEALIVTKKAKSIRKNILGTKHILTAVTRNNLGMIYHALFEYERALSLYEKAMVIIQKVHGVMHLLYAQILLSISRANAELKRFELARNGYGFARMIFQKLNHPVQAEALRLYNQTIMREGNQFMLAGDRVEAEVCYKKSDLPMDFLTPAHLKSMASNARLKKEIPAVIEFLRILLFIDLNDIHTHLYLAEIYHCKAEMRKLVRSHNECLEDIHHAEEHFHATMKVNKSSNILIAYALFLLNNLDVYTLENTIGVLKEAIALKQSNTFQMFSVDHYYTVDNYICGLIYKYKIVFLDIYTLGCYLLVKSYMLNHQSNEAKNILLELHNSIVDEKEEGIVKPGSLKQFLNQVKVILSENHKESLNKTNCNAELFKRAQYLIDTPLEEWDEEEAAEKTDMSTLHSMLIKSPQSEGFFFRKSSQHRSIEKNNHLLLDEFQIVVEQGRVFEGENTYIIAFISFDEALDCQEILYKLGITGTESSDNKRKIDVIEDTNSNKSEYAIRITPEEYENIFGRGFKNN